MMKTIHVLLFVALLSSGGCTAFDLLNATVPSCGYVRTANIAYGPLLRQKLDVYVPKNVKPHATVVIFFYGGEWKAGNKEDYRFAAEALTTKGFIAVLPDYRLYPQVTFPAFVEDGAHSVRWTHDNIARFGGDPGHLFLMGHSAGAHIAALLTLDAHYLKAVGLDRHAIRATAGLSGPYDFVPYPEDLPIFNMKPGQPVDSQIEPINFVDGHEPPMLLLQGGLDTVVQPIEAQHLFDRIREKGGEVTLSIYPDRGHEGVVLALASLFRWLAPVLNDSADFFNRH